MPKMDLSVVEAYGDDIWNGKSDIKIGDGIAAESPAAKIKNKKNRNAQDRVVSAQIYLAVIAVVLFAVIKFIMPNLFQTLYSQYIEFISETPVWNLDGIIDAFSSDASASTIG